MESPRIVGWLDPSLNSRNTGDQIIADAVELELRELFPELVIVRLPTQTFLNRKQRLLAAECDYFIVGGTNLLNGNIPTYLQWKIDPQTYRLYSGKVSLLGVGWWQYQQNTNFLSQRVWRGILAGGAHSIRDEYTVQKLGALGVTGTYTACPTMWRLPSNLEFEKQQPSAVLMTITDYHRNAVRDATLIRGLQERYDEVLAWPQGEQDREYLLSLDRGIRFIESSLPAFNSALATGEYDYVGTRLHAGIRALQLGVKSTIVAVDNRAPEIARSTGLPVVSGSLNSSDWKAIESRANTGLTLPQNSIDGWKKELTNTVLG